MLSRVPRWLRLEIEELDVDSDADLFQIYDDKVPVLRTKEGKVVAAGKWSLLALVPALLRHRLMGS